MSPARAAAWRALRRLHETGAPLDDSLAGLPELDKLSDRDRALAHELVAGTVKRRLSLDAVLTTFVTAPLSRTAPAVLDCLRLAAYQLLFLDRVPAYAVVDDAVAMVARSGKRTQGFVNAVLRKVAAEGRASYAGLAAGDTARAWEVRHSCPGWMIKLARRELGDDAAAELLGAAGAPPERCLRVNTLRGDLSNATAALAAAGFTVQGVPGLPDALRYDGPSLERSQPFREGLVTAQSRGSQVAGICALGGSAPSRVLDLCAAPGTKTAQLAGLAPGASITAVDADAARLVAMGDNLARLGVDGVELVEADATDLPGGYDEAFDAVLLDAPCSGLGTLATRADLRWRRRSADVARLAQLQRALLDRAARCVRPGGSLTYAVCTLAAGRDAGRPRSRSSRAAAGRSTTSARRGRAWRHPEAGGQPAPSAAATREHGVLHRPPAPAHGIDGVEWRHIQRTRSRP